MRKAKSLNIQDCLIQEAISLGRGKEGSGEATPRGVANAAMRELFLRRKFSADDVKYDLG